MSDGPFDRFALEYDNWFERNRWAYLSELSALAKAVPEGRGVDIGSGTGRFSSDLNIFADLDPSISMLRVAREKGLRTVLGRAEDLPFRDGAFDFAMMVTVLCFLQDPLTALREARRVVRPYGRLLIGILDRESPLGRDYEQKAASSRFYQGARFLSASEARALLEKAGCSVDKTYQTLFSKPSGMTAKDPVLEGHGRGLFVVMSAQT